MFYIIAEGIMAHYLQNDVNVVRETANQNKDALTTVESTLRDVSSAVTDIQLSGGGSSMATSEALEALKDELKDEINDNKVYLEAEIKGVSSSAPIYNVGSTSTYTTIKLAFDAYHQSTDTSAVFLLEAQEHIVENNTPLPDNCTLRGVSKHNTIMQGSTTSFITFEVLGNCLVEHIRFNACLFYFRSIGLPTVVSDCIFDVAGFTAGVAFNVFSVNAIDTTETDVAIKNCEYLNTTTSISMYIDCPCTLSIQNLRALSGTISNLTLESLHETEFNATNSDFAEFNIAPFFGEYVFETCSFKAEKGQPILATRGAVIIARNCAFDTTTEGSTPGEATELGRIEAYKCKYKGLSAEWTGRSRISFGLEPTIVT